jgi:hypothetical protein
MGTFPRRIDPIGTTFTGDVARDCAQLPQSMRERRTLSMQAGGVPAPSRNGDPRRQFIHHALLPRRNAAAHITLQVVHTHRSRACGCAGERIEQPGDFAAALLRAMNAAVTTVLDVMIDPLAYPPLTLYEGKLDY